MNSYALLAALQRFLDQQGIDLERLSAESMVAFMIDWYREVSFDIAGTDKFGDSLVFRYGGWSEGCATGFKLSLLRRVTEVKAQGSSTEWFAGITMLFDPSRYSEMAAFSATSSDRQSTDAFRAAVEDSPGFRQSVTATSMGAMLESGGIR